jgi:tetratricopeptide (TPR) repeat protein
VPRDALRTARNTLAPILLLAAAVALLAVAPHIAAQADAEQLWRARNLGKALFETPSTMAQAPAELKKAVELAPASFPDRLNYGVALLRAGATEAAVAELVKAQQQSPRSPYVCFNLGIAYKRLRRLADAVAQFERLIAIAPGEPAAHYNLYGQQDRPADALAQFEAAVRLNPTLVAPRFAIYNHYRLRGDEVRAARALDEFRAAKQQQEASGIAQDMDWSLYAELLDPTLPSPGASTPAPASTPRFEPRALPGAVDPATAGMLALDADGDGRPDLLVWSSRGALLFRHGVQPAPNAGLSALSGVLSLAAGDYDNDGRPDLCALTDSGPLLLHNAGGRFEKVAAPFPAGRFTRAVWLDFDHDYDLDLFLFGETSALLRNAGSRFEDRTATFPFASRAADEARAIRTTPDARGVDLAVAYRDGRRLLYRDRLLGVFTPEPLSAMPERPPVETDFDGDGRPDRVEVAANGRLRLLLGRSPAAAQWLGVTLAGVKNLKLAPLADIEVRAGSFYEKRVYEGAPVYFDLRGRRRADTVRVTWPNGLIQHETNIAAGRLLKVTEAARLSESCPMIYTWNGRAFEFITDVLGVAPLGASAGEGEHFPVDHDEYVRIPGDALAAVDGHYEVRLVEELREVAYIDQARLFAVDHPAGVDIYTNEKFQPPPFPEFRLFGVRRAIAPIAACDHQGRDVSAALAESDGVYAGGFPRDGRGVAEMHALTLDFGRAAPDNRATLLLEGWVDWPDGSTFRAAAQSGRGLVLPYLQVKDAHGEWRTAIANMGLPAGRPKTIAVDLTGRFVGASREVRIVTNLCLYWDRAFLSEDSTTPPARLAAIDAISADLRLRGFTRPALDPRRQRPERFDYARWTPAAPWSQTPGWYTRYGDVRELTQSIDDRFVIMGSGDELRLRFPALPPPAPGERRDFLLLIDGWAKDGDANTAHSQTVEPLPFHAMSGYPYPAGEHYPDDESHRAYRERYNTRPAIRFVSRLR